MTYQLKQQVKEALNRIASEVMTIREARHTAKLALSAIDKQEQEQKELREKYMIEMNKAGIHGEIEFDPDCVVSESEEEGGAYIQAWVWVKSDG